MLQGPCQLSRVVAGTISVPCLEQKIAVMDPDKRRCWNWEAERTYKGRCDGTDLILMSIPTGLRSGSAPACREAGALTGLCLRTLLWR